MSLLSRGEIKKPSLRAEAVTLPSLGGDVKVRGLKLSQRLALREIAQNGNGDTFLAELLAVSVVDKEDQPIFDAEGWDTWASSNTAEFGVLADKALDLGGFGDSAKNG